MSKTRLGLIYCLSFVSLEAFQAVYLGSLFQGMSSFMVGGYVFGISVLGTVVITALFRPKELVASFKSIRLVVALNLFAAVTWCTYFIAIQLIEPAVVFTIFSGMVPLGTIVALAIGVEEARETYNRFVRVGYALILVSIIALFLTTSFGLSGFVRGSFSTAVLGVSLSALSGGCTAFVILYSVRLNARGVGPLAQFGLRFILYTLLAFTAFALGIDDKGDNTGTLDLIVVVIVGLVVIAFPLYLVQKAVPLLPASTIAAMTSLGPIMVFLMQLIEGRVDYAPATLAGLFIYMIGAVFAVWGTTQVKSSMNT